MNDTIHLSIITAAGIVLDEMVSYVEIPAEGGSLGVLAGHAAMLCAISGGILRCTCAAGSTEVRVGAGIANVGGDEVALLVNSAQISE